MYRTFDTFMSTSESQKMKNYLESLEINALCAFGVYDEGSLHLTPETKEYIQEFFKLDVNLQFRESYVALSYKSGEIDPLFESKGFGELIKNYTFPIVENEERVLLAELKTTLQNVLSF